VSDYKSTLIRRLKFESKEVSEELAECNIIYTEAVNLFCSSVSDYCIQHKIKNPLDSFEKKEPSIKKQINNNFKSLFRKIALQTHSDTSQTESHRNSLEKAVEAKKEYNLVDLAGLAQEFKIDMSCFDYDDIRDLENSIEEKKQEIDSMHKSYPWVWYYSNTHNKKTIIKEFILVNV
jgi:hypothetical protein